MTLALTNDKEQVEQVFRRLVFNVIGLNDDDYIKNFSFIHK
ncbi:HipA domain-containing protein [Capnocytophaga genosp. AHN8471]|jgi:hipA-like C-terminal domain|uniref:HipA domain-containing protein n=1 Tax=Capnocytophaga periodontitidis TaxID=2795027 RepID=A0ABS0SNI6_9FLAO|nr:HipA domain-containing protein [Capnocytophaga periodontitidis]MBM0654738.1 HipA domain-containing protein [Capnocytophaga genosp. AHN8471]